MEEKIIIPSITYVGVINEEIYANLVYPAGFGEDTTVTVTLLDAPDVIDSTLVDNYQKLYTDGSFSDTEKTLILATDDISAKYTVTISDPAREDVVLELAYKKPDAQVSSNVHLNFMGSRILEVLFDEPMKQLSSVFDFSIDASNQNGLLRTYGDTTPAKNGLPIKLGINPTNGEAVAFAEFENKKYIINPTGDGTLSTELNYIPNNIVPAYSGYKAIDGSATKTVYILKAGGFSVIKPADNLILASGQSFYRKPITESPNAFTILTNFYFKYFGVDDEGTLYEPAGKPIDWLGYFANDDISFRISPDYRRVEVQFDDYDIPDGAHQLVLNYSKNFPTLTNLSRIKDADNNVFPIVSKGINVEKTAIRAKLIDVIALSRTKVILKYDAPVMVIEDEETVHSSLGTVYPITLNGVKVTTERYENSYNQLLCKIVDPENDALPVGEDVEIEVTGTLDRCGYLVDTATFNVPVSDVQPEVIEFIQLPPEVPTPDEKQTIFNVTFSDIMLKPVDYLENIRFFKVPDGELVTNTIEIKMDDKSNTMQIIVTPALYAGLYYKVQIDGMTNVIKTEMIPFESTIFIKDLSVPYISEILLSDENARVVVKYNEIMNIENSHSIINPQNYQLLKLTPDSADQCEATNKINLDIDIISSVEALRDNTWARLIFTNPLNPEFTENLNIVSHYIKAGYCDVKDVKYVTNISNNVLDFVCPAKHYVVPAFKVADFSVTFKDAQTLELLINSTASIKNEIFAVDAAEFKITNATATVNVNASSAKITPGGRSIILQFPVDTITQNNLQINLKPVKTTDVFGNLLPEFTIDIKGYSTPTVAKDFVLLDSSGDAAKFLVRFSNDIKIEPGVPSTIAAKDYAVEVTTLTKEVIPGRPCTNMATLGNEVTLDFKNLNDYSINETDTFRIGVTSSQLKFNTVEAVAGPDGKVELARVFPYTPVVRGNLVRPYLGNDGTNNKFAIYVDDLGTTLNQFEHLTSIVDEIPLIFDGNTSQFVNSITDSIPVVENNIFESFKIELFNADETPYTRANPISKLVYITNPADLINNALAFNVQLVADTATTVTAKITYKLKSTALSSNDTELLTNRVGVTSANDIIVKTI